MPPAQQRATRRTAAPPVPRHGACLFIGAHSFHVSAYEFDASTAASRRVIVTLCASRPFDERAILPQKEKVRCCLLAFFPFRHTHARVISVY